MAVMEGIVIDPNDFRTWPPECQRRERIRWALRMLADSATCDLEIGERPDGDIGIRLVPVTVANDETKAFLAQYREDLITHVYWLQEMREYHGEQIRDDGGKQEPEDGGRVRRSTGDEDPRSDRGMAEGDRGARRADSETGEMVGRPSEQVGLDLSTAGGDSHG